MKLAPALALLCIASLGSAQTATPPSEPETTTLSSQSTLVLVPALVRNKAGQLVFDLKVDDFVLTDDGIPQKLHLEQDTGGEPLALVVVIEGGGAGASELAKYAALAPMLESVVGAVPHQIAVVGYDSSPVLVQNFTPDNDLATKAIHALIADDNGDAGAATLDSLGFSIDLLRKQPIQYRRAILLLSEGRDRGSRLKLEEAVRAISDTNTAIYAIGFSSGKADVEHETEKLGSSQPGPAHGCFSRDPNDPNVDRSKSAATQSFDCLAELAPPLRLATIAFAAIRAALAKNIPETVARLTGGEYFKLTNEKSLERDLTTISNHIPNRYVLSFQPQAPHPGFHSILLTLPNYANLKVSARNGYWAESAPVAAPQR